MYQADTGDRSVPELQGAQWAVTLPSFVWCYLVAGSQLAGYLRTPNIVRGVRNCNTVSCSLRAANGNGSVCFLQHPESKLFEKLTVAQLASTSMEL